MTGFGALVVSLLGVNIGNTDGGVLDFLIFGVMQGLHTKWYLIPVVGAVWFMTYYWVFKKVILLKDLKTPGREDAKEPEYTQEKLTANESSSEYNIPEILSALGGKSNIISLDNCITRLRMIVKDGKKVDDERLKKLGALGVIHLDNESVV